MPPAETVDAMASGRIDGFCAGAPWGEVAARAGLGRTVATSHAIWNHGTEKVFAVRRRDRRASSPAGCRRCCAPCSAPAAYCDMPANAAAVAAILSQPTLSGPAGRDHPDLAARAPRKSAILPMPTSRCSSPMPPTFPWRSHARWYLREMMRWGYVGARCRIWRPPARSSGPDLYAEAARSVGVAGARRRRARPRGTMPPAGCCRRRRRRSRWGPIGLSTARVFDP